MTTVLLLRHGQTIANAEGVLAGWTPGVDLDDLGREQSEVAAQRLRDVNIAAVLTSPLERCRQTADAVMNLHRADLPLHTEPSLAECRYGDWSGQQLEVLAKDSLWELIQTHPSGVTFPGGEAIADMQSRALSAIRKWNRKLGDTTYVVVTHGDVIKAVIADALGMHLDMFQRLRIDPGSISAVQYSEERAYVARVNDSGGDLASFSASRRRTRRGNDGTFGGESGD